ncbi:MAG: TldD/PmbA family protein [Pyrinomonadaceae bacterium]
MKKPTIFKVFYAAAGLIFCTAVVNAQPPKALSNAVTDELNRNFGVFAGKGTPPPYFMSYSVTDINTIMIGATNGATLSNMHMQTRILDPVMRIGDFVFDNTHLSAGYGSNPISIALDDDYDSIRSSVWIQMDQLYNNSVEALRQAKQSKETSAEDEFKADDFSREKPETYSGKSTSLNVDRELWEKRVKELSAIFKKYPYIYTSSITLNSQTENRFFVNTEGTKISSGNLRTRLMIYATTKAEDGMDLFKFESFEAVNTDGLPDMKTIEAKVIQTANDLMELRGAETIEPFTGPAILSGKASGVFFHEIFGHRIEGHRQKSEYEGNTFTARINQPVLPAIFSVVDDPTMKKFGEIDLNGAYEYDDEGVKSQRVQLVKNGILKTFLMSRSPVPGVDKSNGHGRAQPGNSPVSRQGNLIVQASKTVSPAELRKLLIAEIKRQKKPFGLLFDDISGGFTNTSRFDTQSFQVTPVMVYKVFADGRPDKLVRGLDLIGTPLTVFSKIIAADNTSEVFNGMCGAESGWVPVSAISPGILVSQIEVQKRFKSKESQPILPPPGFEVKDWKGGNGK